MNHQAEGAPVGAPFPASPAVPRADAFLVFLARYREVVGWASATPTRPSNNELAAIAGINHKWLSSRVAACNRGYYPEPLRDSDIVFPLRVLEAAHRLRPWLRDPSAFTKLWESFDAAYPDHPVRVFATRPPQA